MAPLCEWKNLRAKRLNCRRLTRLFCFRREQAGIIIWLVSDVGTPAFSVLLDLNLRTRVITDNGRVGIADSILEKFREKGRIVDISTGTIIVEYRCPDNNVYDSLNEVCRPVYCRAERVFVERVCKPEDEHLTQTLSSPTPATKLLTSSPKRVDTATVHLSLPSTERRSCGNKSKEMDTMNVTGSRNSATYPTIITQLVTLDCPMLLLNASEYLILDNSSALVTTKGREYMRHEYTFNEDMLFVCSPYLDQTYNVSRNVTDTIIMFKFGRVQELVSFIGLLISIPALAIQFIVYMMLPVLRNIPGKCVLSLVASLFVAQLLFLVGTARTEIHEVCVSLAAAMHYAFLAAFFWMNVMAIDICRTFSSRHIMLPTDPHSARFTFYSLYAWLTPAVIVGSSLALDLLEVEAIAFYRPHYGDGMCWITRRWALLVTFAVPLALILVVNFVLFGITVKNLCLISKETKSVRGDDRNQFGLYVKLSTIMGLTWVFGFIASLVDLPVLWYVFVVFNTLQGAFIFFAFVCTRKVFRLLQERVRTHPAIIGSGQTDKHQSSSGLKSGSTRPTDLPMGHALVISKETVT